MSGPPPREKALPADLQGKPNPPEAKAKPLIERQPPADIRPPPESGSGAKSPAEVQRLNERMKALAVHAEEMRQKGALNEQKVAEEVSKSANL